MLQRQYPGVVALAVDQFLAGEPVDTAAGVVGIHGNRQRIVLPPLERIFVFDLERIVPDPGEAVPAIVRGRTPSSVDGEVEIGRIDVARFAVEESLPVQRQARIEKGPVAIVAIYRYRRGIGDLDEGNRDAYMGRRGDDQG